jgi:hypothetical protein
VTIFDLPKSNQETIGISGKSTINLTAATTGMYAGIALFEDRSSSVPISLQDGSFTVTGIVYAPHAALNIMGPSTVVIQGASGSTVRGGLFVLDLTMNGTSALSVTPDGSASGTVTAQSVDAGAGPASPAFVTASTAAAQESHYLSSLAVPDDLARHVLASHTEALVHRLFGGATVRYAGRARFLTSPQVSPAHGADGASPSRGLWRAGWWRRGHRERQA